MKSRFLKNAYQAVHIVTRSLLSLTMSLGVYRLSVADRGFIIQCDTLQAPCNALV